MRVSDLVKQLMEIKANKEVEDLKSLPRRDVPEWFKNPKPMKETEPEIVSTASNVIPGDFSKNRKPAFVFDGPKLKACAAPAFREVEEAEVDWLSIYMSSKVEIIDGLNYTIAMQAMPAEDGSNKKFKIGIEIDENPEPFLDSLSEHRQYGLVFKSGELELAEFEVVIDPGALMIVGEGTVYKETLPPGCIDDIEFILYELDE